MVKKLISRKDFAALAGVSAPAATKACRGFPADAFVGKKVDINHSSVVNYLNKHAAPKPKEPQPVAPGIDPLYEEAVAHCKSTGNWRTTAMQRALRIGYNRATRIKDVMRSAGIVPPGEKSPPEKVAVKPREYEEPRVMPSTAPSDDVEMYVPEDLREYLDLTLREMLEKFGTHQSFKLWLQSLKDLEVIQEKRLKNAQTEGKLIAREIVKIGILDPADALFTRLLTDGVQTITNRGEALVKGGGSTKELKELVTDQISSLIKPAKIKMERVIDRA